MKKIVIKRWDNGSVIHSGDFETVKDCLLDAIKEKKDLRGADLDYSCMPLHCGDLKAGYDDKQIIQQLYHVIAHAINSKNCSKTLKKKLLTNGNLNIGNKFHRVGECGELKKIARASLMKKDNDFLDVNPIICIDCGEEIKLPSHRIPTNDGYKWICETCKNRGGIN